MANAVVTESGGVISTVTNDLNSKYKEVAYSCSTGCWVGLLDDESKVEGNHFLIDKIGNKYQSFDTIATVNITTNQILFDELVKLL